MKSVKEIAQVDGELTEGWRGTLTEGRGTLMGGGRELSEGRGKNWGREFGRGFFGNGEMEYHPPCREVWITNEWMNYELANWQNKYLNLRLKYIKMRFNL